MKYHGKKSPKTSIDNALNFKFDDRLMHYNINNKIRDLLNENILCCTWTRKKGLKICADILLIN